MAIKKANTSKKAATKKSSATKSTVKTKASETKVKLVTATEPQKKSSVSKKDTKNTAAEASMTRYARIFIAEFIASFIFIGVIIALALQHSQFALLFIPLTLLAMVLVVGKISGAHVNPAVTIGALVNKMIGWKQAVTNIAAQLLAGFAAWFTIQGAFLATNFDILEQARQGGYDVSSVTAIAPKITNGTGWWMLAGEVIGTIIFGFGIAAAVKHRAKISVAFGVGLSLMAGLIVGGALSAILSNSGTSAGSAILNPAAALAMQTFSQTDWLFAIATWALAPVVGMIIGMALYRFIDTEEVTE